MITRRRFISISASAFGLTAAGGGAHAKTASYRWRGVALGAEAELLLHHPDHGKAERAVHRALAEVRRLERVFSLFREDSALCHLNRDGRLAAPPPDLVALLSRAIALGDLTGGAFDVSVQPLWCLHRDHFSRPGADAGGPSSVDLARARRLVDYRNIAISAEEIAFARHGMAVTLNGIAQGYITDRVMALLRREGFHNLLVNMGEIRGTGERPDGQPWRVGIDERLATEDGATAVPLINAAVATSAGHGFVFDGRGQHHHLFDPRTGRSSQRRTGVTVIARNATLADALSTAFMAMDERAIARVGRALNIERVILHRK